MSFIENAKLSPQSKNMVERSLTLKAALQPEVWPPGYPLLLFIANQIHYPLKLINLSLFYITLLLLFILSKQYFPRITPTLLPFFYSLFAFNYYNLTQYTSEAIIIPLSLFCLMLLATYLQAGSFLALFLLAFTCSIAFIARYQTVLWLTPVVLANIIFYAHQQKKILILHVVTFVLIAYAPISIVLIRNYRSTGYITGMDRLDWSTRHLSPSISYWTTSTGFFDNITLTLKTYFLDFISPFGYATHATNHAPYPISSLDIVIIISLLLFLIPICQQIINWIRSHYHSFTLSSISKKIRQLPLPFLVAEFHLIYISSTILVWTIGNNDPIYTRFLYPSYIFILIGVFFMYTFITISNVSKITRLFSRLWFSLLLLIQLFKIIYTINFLLPLPYN